MPVIERPESLTAVVLRHLREGIVNGDIALGQPLYERKLAEELGVSKTPVREALAQLRMEGLVHVLPQKGAFVFSLSASEVEQICELRETLENAALDYALTRNPKSLIGAVSAAVATMDAAKAAGMELQFQDLDELAEFALAGIRKRDFVIMIGLEEAEHTLMDRAKRIGKASLPIDLASIPKL